LFQESGANIKYSDFFDPPSDETATKKKKQVSFDAEDEENEEDEEGEDDEGEEDEEGSGDEEDSEEGEDEEHNESNDQLRVAFQEIRRLEKKVALLEYKEP
jgi:U3 small nucleolar ribonucleoprotein component